MMKTEHLLFPSCPPPGILPLMEMNLPNPKAVLINEAFPKGSPRPHFLSTLNRPRHRQAGCKSFRAETFDANEACESQALFQV
jgi:hypothetical protein